MSAWHQKRALIWECYLDADRLIFATEGVAWLATCSSMERTGDPERWVELECIARSAKITKRAATNTKSTSTRSLQMDITTLLIIVLLVVLLGGGGWYGRGRWFGR